LRAPKRIPDPPVTQHQAEWRATNSTVNAATQVFICGGVGKSGWIPVGSAAWIGDN